MGDAETRTGWEPPASAGRRRRTARAAAIVAVLGAVLAALAVAGGGREGSAPPDGRLVVGNDGTASPGAGAGRPGAVREPSGPVPRPPLPPAEPVRPAALDGDWSAHAPPPVPAPQWPRAVWTGRLLVVLAGPGAPAVDGERGQLLAVWDPATSTWMRLEAPIPPRTGAALAWTGREVLVVGGRDRSGPRADGAAWEPSSGRWRSLPPVDAPDGFLAVLWTGRSLHTWTRTPGGLRVHAYDPGADTWAPEASAALARVVPAGAGYARGRPVLWGRAASSGRPLLLVGEGHIEVPMPDGFEPATVTPVDRGVLALGTSAGRPAGAHFVLGRGWEPLATVPNGAGPGWSATAWTGSRLVAARGGSLVAYDPATRRWRDLGAPQGWTPAAGVALAWTGDALLLWGGQPGPASAAPLFAWRPATP